MTRLRMLGLLGALTLLVALPGTAAAAKPGPTSITAPTATFDTGTCVVTASVNITNLQGGHDTLEFILEDQDATGVATGTVIVRHGATSATGYVTLPSGQSIVGIDAHLYKGKTLVASNFGSVGPFSCP